jgi:hypothetical protein
MMPLYTAAICWVTRIAGFEPYGISPPGFGGISQVLNLSILLFRPFVIGLHYDFFPSVLDMINGVMKPTVTATHRWWKVRIKR